MVYPYANPLAGLTTGQTVPIYAVPNDGYQFKQWVSYGGAVLASSLRQDTTVTLTGVSPALVGAQFVSTIPFYSLTVTNDGHGVTSPSGTSSNMIEGTLRSLSAVPLNSPAPGYVFDRWTPSAGIANPGDKATSIIVDGNKTVTAMFKRMWSLTVNHAFGPGMGPYASNMVDGAWVTVTVPSATLDTGGSFRYRCTGWTGGSGSIPETGVYLSYGPWDVATNCSIDWTWAKQYPVTVVFGPGGLTAPLSGETWSDEGSVITLTAVAAAGNDFVKWTVGTNVMTSSTITLTINAPLVATATFAHNADRVTNNVPVWWLDQYGLTNFDADAMRDVDHDGAITWQEWVAGSDPTNRNSVFRFMEAVGRLGQSVVVRWPSISNRVYGVARSTNLVLGTNGFLTLPGATNLPATPTMNSYTDAVQGVGPYFYKIEVHE
jgi:hypothetical protein